MSDTVRVQGEDFDVGAESDRLRLGNPSIGAIASFVGTVRDMNEGTGVSELFLEHYPGMTEQALSEIAVEARSRWRLIDTVIIHRVGPLRPTDQIVLVMVSSAHRGDAFAACEFIMDYLKTRAPFWKKECTPGGTRWVEARESDGHAAARWVEARESDDHTAPRRAEVGRADNPVAAPASGRSIRAAR
jgi:molybdopterin synthase catalytic subunit